MFRWLKGGGARAAEVAKLQGRIPAPLWREVCDSLPFLAALEPSERQALHARSAWLLASKTLNGARGQVLTDAMRLSIAAQACLPILNLPPALYEGWDEIVVYPAGFAIPRSHEDDSGIVHEYTEEAVGEAWDGGPVILSWEDSQPQAGNFNVVIHEFAHKLDLHAGEADGVPYLGGHEMLAPRQWLNILHSSFDRFCRMVDDLERDMPSHVDPESEAGLAYYDRLPIDAYGASDTAEFFAVSSESFFVDPLPLAEALPQWYALLETYYGQNTVARAPAIAHWARHHGEPDAS